MKKFRSLLGKQGIPRGSRKWFVKIPQEYIQALKHWAGFETEVCGILVGRKTGKRFFEVVELIVDKDSLKNPDLFGVTRLTKNILPLLEDLIQTEENYDWIGEWHTHPSSNSSPSLLDIGTMISVINDPEYSFPKEVILVVAGKQCIESWVFYQERRRTYYSKAKLVA